MKNTNDKKDYRDLNKKTKLSEVIPLDSPYLIQISCSDYCNFKCKFCFHSKGMKILTENNFNPGMMSLETFKILADQIATFKSKVKAFRFTGFGEPTLNKDLPNMIQYAKEKKIANQITMFTNGSLLDKNMSLSLIDSGIDEIMLSIEGLSSSKYEELTGNKLNFETFVDNIQFLYNNKKDCKIYAKIIDVGLEDENRFHQIFDPISDLAFVEYASNAYKDVEFTKNLKSNYVGEALSHEIQVCHLPFYYMYVNWNGDVTSCHVDYSKSIKFGNISEKSIVDIWNGKEMNDFRVMQLKKERSSHKICSNCNWVSVCACGVYENIIDNDADELLKYYIAYKGDK